MAATWQATLILGLLTVIAVLFGVLMILSGIFHLIRAFDPVELNRVWAGVSGLLCIVIGVVLIRHLHLTRALAGLFIGITWIVQGLGAIIGGAAGGARERPGLVDRLRRGERGRRYRRRGRSRLLPERARYLM